MKQVSKYYDEEKASIYARKANPSKRGVHLPDNNFLADLVKKAFLVLLLIMVAAKIKSAVISLSNNNSTREMQTEQEGEQFDNDEAIAEKTVSDETEVSENVVINDPIPKDQYLVLLDPFYLNRVWVTNSVYDIRDVHYINALVGDSHPQDFGYAGSEPKPTYVIYDISKYNFKTLSAVVSVEKNSSSKDPDTYGSVFIYGDGNLLYQNAELNCLSSAEEIELDISGIKELRIDIWRSERTDHNIRPLLGNILLSSDES